MINVIHIKQSPIRIGLPPSAANNKENTEAEMNRNLSSTVQTLYNELASQLDLCNNLCAQMTSLQRISTQHGLTRHSKSGPSSGGSLLDCLYTTRRHPQWGDRLKARLHHSLGEVVEQLRKISSIDLPDMARKFDRVQAKDEVDALFKEFDLAMAVDISRPKSDILQRYQFEEDDRALVATHLRRLAALLDSQLDNLIRVIAFENDTDGNHSGKVKHIGGGATARRMSKKANEAAFAISLEPELMLENNTAFGDLGNKLEDGGRKARPLWPVELALNRLRAGGGRCF